MVTYMTPIYLTDSLTKKKTALVPLNSHRVGIYVCGITPYDHAHLGHARCYTVFDTLVRFLSFVGYQVTYVRNYTDIDDKIITKSLQLGLSVVQVSEKYIASYQEDM